MEGGNPSRASINTFATIVAIIITTTAAIITACHYLFQCDNAAFPQLLIGIRRWQCYKVAQIQSAPKKL
jgi:hypothetical protein